MVSSLQKYRQKVQQSLGIDTTGLVFDREYMLDLLVYKKYLVNLLDELGFRFRGESFRYDVPLVLLVVKVLTNDSALVSFVNAMSYAEAVHTFLVKLDEDRIEWREDRFYRN